MNLGVLGERELRFRKGGRFEVGARIIRHAPLFGRSAQPILVNVMIAIGVMANAYGIGSGREIGNFDPNGAGMSGYDDASKSQILVFWPAPVVSKHVDAYGAAGLVHSFNEDSELDVGISGEAEHEANTQ